MSDINVREYLMLRGLTYRESEVAEQVALAKSSRAIGETLFVSEKTIKFHLTAIYKKLGLTKKHSKSQRLELMQMCLAHRFLDEHREALRIEQDKFDRERQEKLELAEKLLKVTLTPGSQS